jgi:SIR2-like protein/pYEATS domain-containing protein involved in immunity
MAIAELLVNERDVDSFERLANCIKGGKTVALVGAGFSARVGYPGWDTLLERMEQRLSRVREKVDSTHRGTTQHLPTNLKRFDDILWRGEEYRDRLGEAEYFAMLAEAFGADPGTDPCVDALVRLPFRHVLTTNYDKTLEITHKRLGLASPKCINWADDEDVLRLMFSFLEHDGDERYLIYLHGCITNPSSIVLTDRDYTQRYLRSDAAVRKLFAIFAMQRIVIFGFSLSDPDLMAILRQVTGALGFQSPRHFAFMGAHAGEEREIDRRRLRTKFGIEAIFYDKANKHEQLRLLMNELLRRCGREVPPPPAASPTLRDSAIRVAVEGPSGPAHEQETEEWAVPVPAPTPCPEDPNKGQFGGLAECNGRRLTAVVKAVRDDPDWFTVIVTVRSTDPSRPLTGLVTFHLHPTFQPTVISEMADGSGTATVELISYGAFTIGAEVDGGATRLELDLASDLSAPERFRLR